MKKRSATHEERWMRSPQQELMTAHASVTANIARSNVPWAMKLRPRIGRTDRTSGMATQWIAHTKETVAPTRSTTERVEFWFALIMDVLSSGTGFPGVAESIRGDPDGIRSGGTKPERGMSASGPDASTIRQVRPRGHPLPWIDQRSEGGARGEEL